MSKNRVPTMFVLISNKRTVRGFIFSSPESLESSVDKEQKSVFIITTVCCRKYGARLSFSMQLALVLPILYSFAILLSGNMLGRIALNLSAKAKTSKLLTWLE